MASDFPTQARVVIIGGGVGGCSIAYHLTKMGWSDVVVLERGELTCGSTWHSAGLVGQLRSDFNLTRMMKYSTDLYRSLKDETGIDTGWREVGGLRLASSPERMEELKRQVGFARSFGMPLELVSTEEAVRMWPLMNPEGVLGAVFTPTDGSIDPTGLTNALAAGARSRGARFFEETTVTAIRTRKGGVEQVETDRGSITTEVVVNAAGQWGNAIAAMVGLRLPIIPFAHLYLITKPIEGLDHDVPTMRDPDHLVYWREEVGGLITGGYERNPKPFGLDGIPDDFKYKLLPPDWERFTPLMENSIHRVPAVEKAEIVQLLNGPEGFTPDGEFLLGPTDVRGFWVAAAFCAHGLAGAGGLGKAMAEWIIEGTPEWNCWRLDVRRFGPHYVSQSFTLNRTIESNSRYYDIHLPGEERQTERNFRLSPAYARERDLGAVFGEKFGWERPNWYAPHEARADHGYRPRGWAGVHWSPAVGYEHLQTRAAAGLFDETSFSKIEVRGPGAAAFLQHLCANDVDRPVGHVVYTSMLNDRGGIECDFTVTRLADDRFLIITGTAFGVHDLNWIRVHAPSDGSVSVEDATGSRMCLGLWGPKARAILERVTRDDVSNAGFPYMTAKPVTVGNVPTVAMRVTYVGELGWEFYCGMEYGQALWDTLWGAGEKDGLVAAGYKAIDTLRLEKGYRYWSADITPDYTPYETGMGFFVRLDKDGFIGKAALEEQKKEGLRQKLCCMSLADPTAIGLGNEPIFNNGTVVGWITSGGYGYSVGKSIAYGFLPVDLAKPGTKLATELFGERITLTVEKEPLFDPKGERIKA
jgi:glycine cleavage system T protein